MNKLKVYSCEGWKRKRGGIEEEEIEKMERRGREKRMRERVSSVRGRQMKDVRHRAGLYCYDI
jgi:hypothetical protein